MADQRLDVIISATDNASATIQKINEGLKGIQTQASTGVNSQGLLAFGAAATSVAGSLAILGASTVWNTFNQIADAAEKSAENVSRFNTVLESGNVGKIVGELTAMQAEFSKFDELNKRMEEAWGGTGSIWEGLSASLALTRTKLSEIGSDTSYLDKLQEDFDRAGKVASETFIRSMATMNAETQVHLHEIEQKALEIDLGAALRTGDLINVAAIREQIEEVSRAKEEAAVQALNRAAADEIATTLLFQISADARKAFLEGIALKEDEIRARAALERQKAADDELKLAEKLAAEKAAIEAKLLALRRDNDVILLENQGKILDALKAQIPIGEQYAQQQTLLAAAYQLRLVALKEILEKEQDAVTGPNSAEKRAELEKKYLEDLLRLQEEFNTTSTVNAIKYANDINALTEAQFALARTLGQASLADEVAYWSAKALAAKASTTEQDEYVKKSIDAQKALRDAALSQFSDALNAQSELERALENGRIITIQQTEQEVLALRKAAFQALDDYIAGRPANEDLVQIGIKLRMQGTAGNDLGTDIKTVLAQALAPLQDPTNVTNIPAKMQPRITINGKEVDLAALEGTGITLNGQPVTIPAKVTPSITLNGQVIDIAAFESGAPIVLNANNPATLTGAFALDQVSQKIFNDLQAILTNAPPPIQLGVTAAPGSVELLDKFSAIASVGDLTITAVGDEAINRLVNLDDLNITLDPLVQQMFQEPPLIRLEAAAFSLFDSGLPSIIMDPAIFTLFEGGLPQITLNPTVFDSIPSIGLDTASFSLLEPFADGITVGITPDAFSLLANPLLVGIDPAVAAVLGGDQLTIGIDPAAVSLFGQEAPRIGIDPAAVSLFENGLPSILLDPTVPAFFAAGVPQITLDPTGLSDLPSIGLDQTSFSLLQPFESGITVGISPEALTLLSDPLIVGLDPTAATLFGQPLPPIVLDPAAFALFEQGVPSITLDPAAVTLFASGLPQIGVDQAAFDAIPSIVLDPASFSVLEPFSSGINVGLNADALSLLANPLLVGIDPAAAAALSGEPLTIGIDPAAVSLFNQEPPIVGIDPAAFTLFDQISNLTLPSITLDPAVEAFTAPSVGLDPDLTAQIAGLTLPEFGVDPAVLSLFAQEPPRIGIEPEALSIFTQEPPRIGVEPEAFSLFEQVNSLVLPSFTLDPVPSQIAALQLPSFGVDPAAVSLFAQAPPVIGIDPAAFTLFDQLSTLTLPMVELDPAVTSFFSVGLPNIGIDPSIFSLTLPEISLEASAFSLLTAGIPPISLDPSASNLLNAGNLTLGVDVSADLLAFLDSDLTVDVNIDSTALELFSTPLTVETNIDPQFFTLFDAVQKPISLAFDLGSADAIASLGRLSDPAGFQLDLQLGAGFDTANELLDTFANNVVGKAEIISTAIADGARNGLADGVVDAIVNNLTEGLQREIDRFS